MGDHGKKRLYRLALLVMSGQFASMPLVAISPWPTATYLVLLASIGVPVGAMLVLSRVLISDVIDFDEKRTGLRREAMYFGMQGLIDSKISFGVGPLIATQLFTIFGNTADRPLGVLLCGPAPACSASSAGRPSGAIRSTDELPGQRVMLLNARHRSSSNRSHTMAAQSGSSGARRPGPVP